MKKLPKGKNAKAMAKEPYFMLLPYKQHVHSITSDNGTEFYEHKWIAHQLNTKFYFAHPYSSRERGLNEYTSGLIRWYIPKKNSILIITLWLIWQIFSIKLIEDRESCLIQLAAP